MKASVIIVNWNGKSYLEPCLNSLKNQTFKDFETIFVDNASEDDSIAFVKNNFPRVKIIKNKKNFGFAEGNNIGIKQAKGEYIILLNNDAAVNSDFVKNLVAVADSDKEIGMIAPKTLFYHGMHIDTLGLKLLISGLAWDIKNENEISNLFCPSGVAALYRKTALDQAKLNNEYLDREYFCYAEDLDLGFRLRLIGWKCTYVKNAIARHVHSGSTNNNFAVYHGHRNNLLTIVKNFPADLLVLYSIPMLFAQFASLAAYLMRGKFLTILKAKLDAIKLLPKMLKKRKIIQKRKTVNSREIKSALVKKLFA
jgi:hypothetical protein